MLLDEAKQILRKSGYLVNEKADAVYTPEQVSFRRMDANTKASIIHDLREIIADNNDAENLEINNFKVDITDKGILRIYTRREIKAYGNSYTETYDARYILDRVVLTDVDETTGEFYTVDDIKNNRAPLECVNCLYRLDATVSYDYDDYNDPAESYSDELTWLPPELKRAISAVGKFEADKQFMPYLTVPFSEIEIEAVVVAD